MPPAIPTISSNTGTTDAPIPTIEYGERRQPSPRTSPSSPLSVKVPMVPAHTRSPEAHVEAPTAGSLLLAGIPPKSGTHGSSRSNTPMCPVATPHPTPSIHGPTPIATAHTPPTTPRQTDPKRNIAHPPVAHTNPATPGISSRPGVGPRSPAVGSVLRVGSVRSGVWINQADSCLGSYPPGRWSGFMCFPDADGIRRCEWALVHACHHTTSHRSDHFDPRCPFVSKPVDRPANPAGYQPGGGSSKGSRLGCSGTTRISPAHRPGARVQNPTRHTGRSRPPTQGHNPRRSGGRRIPSASGTARRPGSCRVYPSRSRCADRSRRWVLRRPHALILLCWRQQPVCLGLPPVGSPHDRQPVLDVSRHAGRV